MRRFSVLYSHICSGWHSFTHWRSTTSIYFKFALSLLMASFTGLCAQLRIYLPWTPVPITLQTLAVLSSPFVLGIFWGTLSQFLYVLLGLLGIPWFAGWNGGIHFLFSPTFGYLIGFIFCAFTIGFFISKTNLIHSWLRTTLLLFLCNFICIYLPGLIFLWVWYINSFGTLSLSHLLAIGFYPFVLGDILKITILSSTHRVFLHPVSTSSQCCSR